MCGVMAHRGPDDEGVYIGDGVAMGMRRLSIIDLDNGYQPISNEDGTVWIGFNCEIYNYQELRRDLEKRGHTLRTAFTAKIDGRIVSDQTMKIGTLAE